MYLYHLDPCLVDLASVEDGEERLAEGGQGHRLATSSRRSRLSLFAWSLELQ